MSPSRLAVARETRQARQNHPEITRRVFGESAVGTSIIRAPFTSLHNPDHLIRVGVKPRPTTADTDGHCPVCPVCRASVALLSR
jgi:hypothetical protein